MPIFLQKKNHRVKALIRLLLLALKFVSVIQYQVRKELKATGQSIKELYPGNPGRATTQTTTKMLLEAFQNITLVVVAVENRKLRRKDAKNAIFVSVIEPHGEYNPVAEIPDSPFSSVSGLEVLYDESNYSIIRFKNQSGKTWTLLLANQEVSAEVSHKVEMEEETFTWKGPYHLTSGSNLK